MRLGVGDERQVGPSGRSAQAGSHAPDRPRGYQELGPERPAGTPAPRAAADRRCYASGRAARDALPPRLPLSGAPDLTTTKPARGRPAPRLQSPPSCHLRPRGPHRALRRAALPCPRGRADSGARPSANFSRGHRASSRDPGRAVAAAAQQEGSGRGGGRPAGLCGRRPYPGAEGGGAPRPRLRYAAPAGRSGSRPLLQPVWRGRRVGALLRFSSGVAAGRGGDSRHRPSPLSSFLLIDFFLSPGPPSAVPSPVEPRGADLAGNAARPAGTPHAAVAPDHHPWYRRWPLYRPMRL